MEKIGFDNDKYLSLQSERIRERIAQFGGKLYMEFGGKLFDDYHASRVLPGFEPDSKVKMLAQLKEDVEIVVVINAADIEKNKVRGDLGITYDMDVLRLIDAFHGYGLYVGSVVLTRYDGSAQVKAYQKKLEALGLKVYRHYSIPGYPLDVPFIISDDGYGKNEFIETEHSLVVVTAPGPMTMPVAIRPGPTRLSRSLSGRDLMSSPNRAVFFSSIKQIVSFLIRFSCEKALPIGLIQ